MSALAGPYDTGVNPADYGLPANIGVREIDYGFDMANPVNSRGRMLERIVFYGHDAQGYADAFAAKNYPIEIMAAIEPKEGDSWPMQKSYQALPLDMGIAAIIITPGTYNGQAAKPFDAANKSQARIGELDVCGLAGLDRPILDASITRGAFIFFRQDHVGISHLIMSGINIAHDAGSLFVRGVAQTGSRRDGIHIGNYDEFMTARRANFEQDATGKVLHKVYDWEAWSNGRGNAYHNAYVQFSYNGLCHFDHCHSYAAWESICIKAPCQNVAVTNSIVSCVAKIEESHIKAKGYVSTNPLDLKSAGDKFVDNTLIISATGRIPSVGSIAAHPCRVAARRSEKGSNHEYMYGSPEYNDPQTWQAYKEAYWEPNLPVKPNSDCFWGNIGLHVIRLADFGGTDSVSAICRHDGQAPRWAPFQFSTGSVYGELNDEVKPLWQDMSRTYLNVASVKSNAEIVLHDGSVVPPTVIKPSANDAPLRVKLFDGGTNDPAVVGYDTNGKPILGNAPEWVPDRNCYTPADVRAVLPQYFAELVEPVKPPHPPPDELVQIRRTSVVREGRDLRINILIEHHPDYNVRTITTHTEEGSD